jgi:hypothetical protein
MNKIDISRLYELNGAEKDIYLYCASDENVKKGDYISVTYHIFHKLPDVLKNYGREYNKSTLKKAMGALVKKEFLRKGERRGDYYLKYEQRA